MKRRITIEAEASTHGDDTPFSDFVSAMEMLSPYLFDNVVIYSEEVGDDGLTDEQRRWAVAFGQL